MDICVGTDPGLALETRRGTGFYKVPSLRGVWMRNVFGHEGRAASLEEWFDPARLNQDYVPKGFTSLQVRFKVTNTRSSYLSRTGNRSLLF